MGRGESKPVGKTPDKESNANDKAQAQDDLAVLMKAMAQAMETMTTALSEKMIGAISDLKASLVASGRICDELNSSSQDEYARPDKAMGSKCTQGLASGFPYERSTQDLMLGHGPGPSPVRIQLEKYTGMSTKTLPANWMRSYESMASLQNWSDQHKIMMLRFYLADEAITWFDNQQGLETRPWSETRDRFEKYFSQDKVVTPKMVLEKEWDPKTSSFYEHYREMLRLFEISGLQAAWRTKVLKTSLPPFYARMCSGVETDDADEWYQRAAGIISSLPKYEAKPMVQSKFKAIAAVQEVKTLSRKEPDDIGDKTEVRSRCLYCCQTNPNHKLEDCFCHPRKLSAEINMLAEADDILDEADLENGD